MENLRFKVNLWIYIKVVPDTPNLVKFFFLFYILCTIIAYFPKTFLLNLSLCFQERHCECMETCPIVLRGGGSDIWVCPSLHNVLLYTPSQNTKTEIQKIQIQNIGRETQKYKPTNAHYTLSYYTRHPRIQVPKYKNAQHKNNKKNNQIIFP